MMKRLAFEDFPAGTVLRFGGYEVTEQEIIAFAREYDPQVMHLDAERARNTPAKGLIAPGMLTCSMVMRLSCDHYLNESTSWGAPGVAETRWLRPVRPGMILNCELRVTSARISQSRPEMGLVGMEVTTRDQTDEAVMFQRYTALFGRRDTTPPAAEPDAPKAERPARSSAPIPSFDDPVVNRTRFAGRYADVVVGARMELGSRTFTRDDIIGFASKYDPQPFHLSDEGAARSHFGRLAASGWQTAATYMRLFVTTRNRVRAEASSLPYPLSAGRPSPGFSNLRWIRPTYAGDTLTYTTTVIAKEPLGRPGLGLVRNRVTALNQDGVQVFEMEGTSLATID